MSISLCCNLSQESAVVVHLSSCSYDSARSTGQPASTPNSQTQLEEMRVILEKGDKPEVKELVRQLQKLVPGIVIIEDETQQEHWL